MKRRFVLTPRARQDVNDIWDYIADDNIEAADRVLGALENAMVKLAKNPGIGHWREELIDKRHRFLSGLFVLDRLSARNEAPPDYPGSSRCPRRAEYSWPGARRAVAGNQNLPRHGFQQRGINHFTPPLSWPCTPIPRGASRASPSAPGPSIPPYSARCARWRSLRRSAAAASAQKT
jgi:plasmid stabilization system protein ParE